MIGEAFRRYPAAVEEASAIPECEVCTGDGETDDGEPCQCMLMSFLAAHEAIDWD